MFHMKELLLLIPSDGARYIEWGFSDKSLRLYSTKTGKLVCIWKVKNQNAVGFTSPTSSRGHVDMITTSTASRFYGVIITGSESYNKPLG
ncbi:hypothetical protein RO3G_10506 [Rhizopus delemar RA 99-880]|uniref:Uncharacterized protein n=1 Tax=Rhizopus delemar (strain RA 99-880 / ATCC MYA-4621 / FGSC 9543 / NRRL 43880) TaxID=246409 RepID=I1CBG6_RHIO9|nr:hypothetical protein RO3G_10506 [Rhizopus delemar RA 99-880]|eukprot:EIE85796.1 hypothetical protein RO3G_10506 [Rhizopus delemar RA 99-880]